MKATWEAELAEGTSLGRAGPLRLVVWYSRGKFPKWAIRFPSGIALATGEGGRDRVESFLKRLEESVVPPRSNAMYIDVSRETSKLERNRWTFVVVPRSGDVRVRLYRFVLEARATPRQKWKVQKTYAETPEQDVPADVVVEAIATVQQSVGFGPGESR